MWVNIYKKIKITTCPTFGAILKSQIGELRQSLIKAKEPEFGFTDTSNIESLSLSDNNYEELKSQHQRDINEVQNILDQLKDLVEE